MRIIEIFLPVIIPATTTWGAATCCPSAINLIAELYVEYRTRALKELPAIIELIPRNSSFEGNGHSYLTPLT